MKGWTSFLDDLKPALICNVNNFEAGRIKDHALYWQELTSDPWILNAIERCGTEFEDEPNIVPLHDIVLSQEERDFVDMEISRL